MERGDCGHCLAPCCGWNMCCCMVWCVLLQVQKVGKQTIEDGDDDDKRNSNDDDSNKEGGGGGGEDMIVILIIMMMVIGCLFVGCLTSQQHASVSQGRICIDSFTCCHTEIEAADPAFHLTQSQYTDTGPTSPSTDPLTPGAWQGSHWSANG